jgi:hypothetical protein
MTIQALSPLSDEFGEVERLLQVQLNAPQLKVSECLDLTSAPVDAAFQSYATAMLPSNVVTAFVLASQIPQPYTEIAANGLKVDPRTGVKVTLGSFEVDRNADSLEVLVLTIALGASLNYQPPALAKSADCEFLTTSPTYADVKPGYHSLCVSKTNQYIVFNPAQVKVSNFVRFAGGENIAESTEADNLCDACRAAEATVFCLNDSAKLCSACDEQSHKVNAILGRHVRLPIAEARSRIERCPLHPKTRVDYYCPQCKLPVCETCKMTGNHSTGAEASHGLIPIQDAYAQAIEATAGEDPIIVRRKTAVAEKLATSERLLDEVLANEESVETEIRKMGEESIEQAKRLAGEKALVVRSVQTELYRKLAEMDAVERSLNAHRKKSGPQAFLRAVNRQVPIVAAFQGTGDLPLDVTVHGDLTVFGNLQVGGLSDADAGSRRSALIVAGVDSLDTSTLQDTPTTPIRKRGISGLAITSLALVAQKKARRNRGVELTFQPFHRSRIITDPDFQAQFYRVFPFRGAPQPHLLFATGRDGRSIEKLHTLVDGIGITVVLIQVGDAKFGGFAASKWNSDGVPFGEEGCSFLFSINKDAVVPFKPAPNAYQLFAKPDVIAFGKTDLVLAGNFDECASEIEGSYGIGLPPGGEEAKTFLAGVDKFVADQVEVWGFYTVD